MPSAPWEKLLPRFRGRLPGGGDLLRTDPGGSSSARIAILGLHPVETSARVVRLGRDKLRLPAAVEERSFEGSDAAKALRLQVLAPLRLAGDQVYTLDAYPYYLASDAARGDRSMWSSIELWRKASGETDDVQQRPEPSLMPKVCRELPGNLERLADQLKSCRPAVLLTLGAEVAALARDCSLADGQRALYLATERRTVFGVEVLLAHLAHPGILTSPLGAGWRAKHLAWCAGEGADLIARHLPAQAPR